MFSFVEVFFKYRKSASVHKCLVVCGYGMMGKPVNVYGV